MATQVLNARFQLKRGLAEAWSRNNPILASGEPGWTLDTHILKIGDGKTRWLELEEISGANIDPTKETYTKKEIDELIASAKDEVVAGLHKIATSGSLYDAKEVSTAKNSAGEDVACLILYCGSAFELV